ncbi:DUF3307 domain-containing protein [Reichenbachiella sp. MALMAid0571]|uniref:DUF3307 domain-containing protein n=1 Tax=Reichenbachiella sp. MALMAid0571 TaxID=3143939 RepID=UPI0032DEEA2C
MILLSLKLILAHIIGDFVFQPNQWVKDKELKKQKSPYLYAHLLIHTVALCIVLQFDTAYWGAVVAIVISHFVIDLIKLYLNTRERARILFFADQMAHLLVIVVVVCIYESDSLSTINFYEPQIFLLATAILLVSVVSAIVMKVIMTKWNLEEDAHGDSLTNAGKYIGMLERLFVFVFILLNQWQAIGFLIAAKSVFRFGDLSRAKDRKLTEYILIGTLMSFGLAIIIGLGYQYTKVFLAK